MSQDQQKQMQKRESTGEAVTQNQRGGLKKDRQISREIFRNANNRMRAHRYHGTIAKDNCGARQQHGARSP